MEAVRAIRRAFEEEVQAAFSDKGVRHALRKILF
jgi:hypothetical protein